MAKKELRNMEYERKTERTKLVYIIFTWMAVCCGAIWVFTNLSYDCEYEIAMSYRLLRGDKMLLEMWEPHQTSIFLPAALMWIYIKLTGTTTGIALYLQICGIMFRGAIAVLLYRMLRKDINRKTAYGMALLYFMVSPKDYAMPEFSNLQLWYSTLLFCCLWSYLKTNRFYLLILGAFCLCLEVLAYPSCVIVLLGVIGLLAMYSSRKRRDILVFTGICAGLGMIVGGYFLFTLGPDTLKACISGMLALEPSHMENPVAKLLRYGKDIFVQIGILAAAGGIGLGVCGGIYLISGRKQGKREKIWYWLLCCSLVLLTGFLANILSVENRCAYSVIFLFITGIGVWNSRKLEGKERQIYVCGSVIGGLGFLATLILSDLPFSVSVPYGLLAFAAALIPIEKGAEEAGSGKAGKWLCYCFLSFMVLLAFRCAYIRTPLTGRGQICSTFSGMSIVRDGPALGIISDEQGVCIQRDSYPEWKELIQQGDKVWIVGGTVDTLGYLYQDVEVAGPSTMSTPFYCEAILEYWRLNPDKYPDVIVVESYMGEISYDLLANDWLIPWIEEEYRPEQIEDGIYWKYYFRKNRS